MRKTEKEVRMARKSGGKKNQPPEIGRIREEKPKAYYQRFAEKTRYIRETETDSP